MKLLSLAALVLIVGCAATPSHQHGAADYCADYRATMAGKTVEEQRKAAEAHIERHMRMMERRCGNAAG